MCVTVGLIEQDALLALGVTPVATREWFGEQPGAVVADVVVWLVYTEAGASRVQEQPDPRPELLNATDAIPFEKIVGLGPDLILATDNYELSDNYTRLARIAPTLSYIEGPESDTWQQRTALIGRALGRDEQAQKIITDIEAKLTQTAQANPAFAGRTFSRSYAYQGEVRAITRADASVALLEQLGLQVFPEVAALPQADTPGRATVSLENLHVLDADVMMISYPSDADRLFLESSPLFQQLNAVKNGTYVVLDQPTSAALGFPSALSIPYGLDRTVAAVANVLA